MERVNITVPAKYVTLSLLLPFQFPVDIMVWKDLRDKFLLFKDDISGTFLCDKKYIVESIVRSKVYSVTISMFLG